MDFGTLKIHSVKISIVIAFVAGIFSYSTLQSPLSAWIWPAALLFAVRSVSKKRSIIISFGVILSSMVIGFIVPIIEMISSSPDALIAFVALAIVTSLVYAIPFVIDRMFIERIGTVQQLFLFPLVLTTGSFIISVLPLGTVLSFAYSQTNFLYFTQGLSIYGMFGMIFILGWFATSVNLFMRTISEKDKRIRWTAVCAAVVIAVIIFGGVRLAIAENSEKIDVICAEGPYCAYSANDLTLSGQIAAMDKTFDTAVAENAEMIVFYEESFFLKQEWITPFGAHAAERSNATGIYLVFAARTQEGDVFHNTCTFVTPENGVEWTYNKTNLVPMMESTNTPGDGTIYCTDTPIGRITSVICMDLEYPYFVNNIDKDADILTAPSYDWKGLEGWNARNTSFRSIENGVCLIKATMDGTSSTYDAYGRLDGTYTAFDERAGSTHILSASTNGCRTIYGEFGHIIDWAFVALTILILLSCIYTYRKGFRNEQD